jgi:Cu(I)/Ag(I) efflux system membrane protein CusA/SilA
MTEPTRETLERRGPLDRLIRFCLENKLVVFLALLAFIGWGIHVAPFDWEIAGLPRDPVPTDAIPDIGENQQIVFTEWMGRSPRDVEDQITYPMTVSLLGVPGVKTVRSYSFFGFSTIYVIFDDKVDFYWSRSRVLEKLSSLPAGTLPEGVKPTLGPDSTALGQIFWYTLEGRDPDGNPAGGWGPDELRTIQDWTVRYAVLGAEGISEVGSVGGFVREYQIDVDPDAMRSYGVTLEQVFNAVKMSNVDVGARTIEVNKVEYVIRGLGFIKQISDIEETVVGVHDNVPVLVKNIAHVSRGPALRRGALDKDGAEAAGGVVVVRYGYNPLAAIKAVKARIAEIAPGLPAKAVVDWSRADRKGVELAAAERGFDAYKDDALNQDAWLAWLRAHPRKDWPAWVTTSQVTVVPFYDRTGLIYETLGTLNTALIEEILVTMIVVIVGVMHLRSALLISSALPLSVLMAFIAMKLFHVDANIVALSGIAIAIGTVVDMSIILCENILRHLEQADPAEPRLEVVFRASSEVGGAVLTAVLTTIIGFLPVFTMTGPEGKLFKPLAFTKTFALAASVIVALTIVPAWAHMLFTFKVRSRGVRRALLIGLIASALVLGLWLRLWLLGGVIVLFAAWYLVEERLSARWRKIGPLLASALALLIVGVVLTRHWAPLGPERGLLRNLIFVGGLIGSLLLFFYLFRLAYPRILRWCLAHKLLFMSLPTAIALLGLMIWIGFPKTFGFVPAAAEKAGADPQWVKRTTLWTRGAQAFPGLGKEFMPPLDEGSYLYMPTTMPHASIGEVLDIIEKQDMAFRAIPEVETVVGKLGRADTPLDPAPISMIETVINYKSEYLTDRDGRRRRFAFDAAANDLFRDEAGHPLPAPDGQPYTVRGKFKRDAQGNLVADPNGMPFRLWRPMLDPALNPGRGSWPGVVRPGDIWDRIVEAGNIPGTTSAPRLQPIAARIVMLQSGMRAPMGVKVFGPDLDTVERVGLDIERFLKEVPAVEADAVLADRIAGKPYLEIDINREAIARYGMSIRRIQDVIEVAIGGSAITTTVEGRERYPVRVRYMRELRDRIDTLGKVLVPAMDGAQIPLDELADIRYVRGPQMIKSEDTFLVGYVIFDKKPGYAEVDVVESCEAYLKAKRDSGEFPLPPGVSYRFSGNYENQIHAARTLAIVLPLALFLIFMVLYFQFRAIPTTFLVFFGIAVAWAGGFLLIWLYGRPWFLDFSLFGVNMRDLFQIHPINLSVAVWVGFLALFGIASDDGVVIATYLDQSFAKRRTTNVEELRAATLEGARRRVRPCLMTTATTILALLPVLTSVGRGSDIMVPMAIPSFGGMTIEIITMLIVPVLYCAVKEFKLRTGMRDAHFEGGETE